MGDRSSRHDLVSRRELLKQPTRKQLCVPLRIVVNDEVPSFNTRVADGN